MEWAVRLYARVERFLIGQILERVPEDVRIFCGREEEGHEQVGIRKRMQSFLFQGITYGLGVLVALYLLTLTSVPFLFIVVLIVCGGIYAASYLEEEKEADYSAMSMLQHREVDDTSTTAQFHLTGFGARNISWSVVYQMRSVWMQNVLGCIGLFVFLMVLWGVVLWVGYTVAGISGMLLTLLSAIYCPLAVRNTTIEQVTKELKDQRTRLEKESEAMARRLDSSILPAYLTTSVSQSMRSLPRKLLNAFYLLTLAIVIVFVAICIMAFFAVNRDWLPISLMDVFLGFFILIQVILSVHLGFRAERKYSQRISDFNEARAALESAVESWFDVYLRVCEHKPLE